MCKAAAPNIAAELHSPPFKTRVDVTKHALGAQCLLLQAVNHAIVGVHCQLLHIVNHLYHAAGHCDQYRTRYKGCQVKLLDPQQLSGQNSRTSQKHYLKSVR